MTTTPQQQPTHTPEPWRVETSEKDPYDFAILHDDQWGSVYAAKVSIINTTPNATAANAQRIVACVNACAGLSDPAAALQAAREALERSLDWLASYPGDGALPVYDQARAALQQLRGEAQP